VRTRNLQLLLLPEDRATPVLEGLQTEILEVRYKMAILEQYAQRMAIQYHKYSDKQFINWKRIDVYISFDRVASNETNQFMELLLRKTFRDTLKGLTNA